MKRNIVVFFLWIFTVYYVECDSNSQRKTKREEIKDEKEPHPYTISFFTFPKGAANELLKPKRESKRDNPDLSFHKKIKQLVSKKETKSKVNEKPKVIKESSIKKEETKQEKNNKKYHQTKERPINKLKKEKQNYQHLEPWSPIHKKAQNNKQHAAEQQTESYQEGSIKHPLHTMYPKCHHCPSNSSYEDCVSKSTLKKCNIGLNNICFTKSFQSNSRGIIYEMGCSNHRKCQKAKATPCKGTMKNCFVCCQFDGCNALEHHYYESKQNDDDSLGYSSFNKATPQKWSSLIIIGLSFAAFMLT
ncbi:uncharacterized protein LOC114522558 [Dendronephthya gigantea]|uniref:uncharacterized protein LOC114522558 n=1 Tax=Dendronephthya gigantea TaxID=151771 RepID=UPI0010695E80|nr:uncharacterized protein LOC114522558 [Dendronephthya gigantea]XP_028399087.1 uncharacterized protein LOC114522558 [Dendronephthya gigantea]